MEDTTPAILFTAFEPSGDEHAAPVIADLRRRRPDIPIWALGGPKMAAAGARLIETTTESSAMGLSALSKAAEHQRLLGVLRQWWTTHHVAVHVPTDSPAANWAICKIAKRHNAKVAHLVAPQIWAWATWRVSRLRRWSDLTLCLLPFEPQWFKPFGVRARFIGHPLFDEPMEDTESLTWQTAGYPTGRPRIALLPGSRPGEIHRHWPIMAEAFERLRTQFPEAQAVVATPNKQTAKIIRTATPKMPPSIMLVDDGAETALAWADVVLTASGTATLHVARHGKPMVVIYKTSPITWHLLGRWLINTRTFTLPNLIAAGGPHCEPMRHIVREFVPYLGDASSVKPVVEELIALLTHRDKAAKQVDALKRVVAAFDGYHAGPAAAAAICEMYDDEALDSDPARLEHQVRG